MKLREALAHAADQLKPVSATPRLDAELLMAYALGIDRSELLNILIDLDRQADAQDERWSAQAKLALNAFALAIARRKVSEPIAYIIGERDFWTVTIGLTPDVLIPRPDTETLMEAAVGYFGNAGPARVLDLGTGSGALACAAMDQWPSARCVAIDISEAALEVARANADRIAPGRIDLMLLSWNDSIDGIFNLILCNPPYIEEDAALPADVRDYEPATALFAGADGLDCYREIIPTLPRLLAPGGMIAVEIGSTQAEAVSALFRAAGLSPRLRHDLAGHPRAIVHFALGSDDAKA